MAIDDNTSYELTGYQVKDLAQKVRAKADSASLANVATSGLYSDLIGAPSIPTVYNGTLTVTQGGNTLGTFTANQSSNATIDIPTGGSTYTAGNGIDITNDTISIDTSVVAEVSDIPTATSDLTNDSGFITSASLPTKTSDLTNDGSDGTSTYVEASGLAAVATSGSYTDLSNKPTIPAAQVNSDWNASSGVAEILNKPTLATVATSGAYSDLSGTPTIPTVNNATLTVTQNGTSAGTFTANASSDVTIALTDTTYSAMTGASSGAAGTSGLVPAPAAGDESKVLSGAGTWVAQSGGGSTYTAGNGISISANNEISIDTSVVAELSDLPTVNDGTLTIQHNGTTKGTFTANQSTASTVNIETIYADDYISTSPIPTTVTTAMIEDGAVTAAKTAFGGNYSTSEVNTGFTWIDGKPIYKKTVDFGALPNNTVKHVNHGVVDMARVIKIEGIIQMSSTNWTTTPLVYKGVDSTYNAEFQVTTTFVHCATNQDRSSLSAIVTIWYTKTTD